MRLPRKATKALCRVALATQKHRNAREDAWVNRRNGPSSGKFQSRRNVRREVMTWSMCSINETTKRLNLKYGCS